MPKRIAPLSDMQVSKIKPQEKQRSYLMVEVFFFWSHHLAVSCGD